MTNIALIFPGQGAQKVGMGREFYEADPAARDVFEKASQVLGEDIAKVIFEGPQDKLMSTAYCQPAIFTMSMAALAAFRASDKSKNVLVKFTAGLSLGEYSAMCAAGAISFADGLRLIQKRGAFMEEAVKANPGKMAAIIGFDKDKLVGICKTAGCEIANFNAPDQIVITGKTDALAKACQLIAEQGGKKVIPLDVSGAFHSSLMKPAADKFAEALKGVEFKVSDVKVISNVSAKPQCTVEELRQNLPRQIYSSVLWVDSMNFLLSQGITDLVEVGPGRVLKGLIRKIDPALKVHNIQVPDDIAALPF
jgi:[acyl-carrier-protein] S-malonyltransferase